MEAQPKPRVTSPSAVSARLRKAGHRITTNYANLGLLVSKSGTPGVVSITCIRLNDEGVARLADALEADLRTWEDYTYTRTDGGDYFTVQRKP